MWIEILKFLNTIKSIGFGLREWLIFLRRYGFFSPPVILTLAILIGIGYFVFIKTISFIDNHHKPNIRRLELEKKIEVILKECGDKTAISIGSISLNKKETDDFWIGIFEIAEACDIKQKDCLIDLRTINSTYRNEIRVDLSTYKFLERIGNNEIPSYFNLRVNGEQNLDSTNLYPAMQQVLTNTIWFQQKILQSLWITSVVNFNKKVLYLITFTSAKEIPNPACINQTSILADLKSFVKDKL